MAVTQPPPSIAPTLLAGVVIGFVAIFGFFSALLLAAGTSVGTTLAFATFVAAFGGSGFGTMFGANYYCHRHGEPS